MILILGFGPFAKWKVNPAGVLAKELDSQIINSMRVHGLEIPVSTKFIINDVPQIITRKNPKIVVGLGLSTRINRITVERVAINLLDFTQKDVDGVKFEDTAIFKNGPAAYFTNINVKYVIKKLRSEGIPVGISYSAGTFLCNALFYTIMHTIKSHSMDALGAFLHIPPFPEMVVDKDLPSMDKDLLKSGIIKFIDAVIEGHERRDSS